VGALPLVTGALFPSYGPLRPVSSLQNPPLTHNGSGAPNASAADDGASSLSHHLDRHTLPLQAMDAVRILNEAVWPDCDTYEGKQANIRLAWNVPRPDAGRPDEERDGWRVYTCELTRTAFSVPHGAPVPGLASDTYASDGTMAGVGFLRIHPDLVDDPERLYDRLAHHLREEIVQHLMRLTRAMQLADGLRAQGDLPFGRFPSPYRGDAGSEDYVGYAPKGDRP